MVSIIGPVFILLVIAISSTDAQPSSAEVCQEIRDGDRKILAMGSRGYNNRTKHRFYLLTEGGYLFSVPFANLTLNTQSAEANKLVIDTEYQLMSDDDETPESFTAHSRGSGDKKFISFFLISNLQDEHFVVRLNESVESVHRGKIQVCFQTYYLDGIARPKTRANCLKRDVELTRFVMSVESNDTFKNQALGYQMQQAPNGWNATWKYSFSAAAQQVYQIDGPRLDYLHTESFSIGHEDIIAAFYYTLHKSSQKLVLLTSNGTVIIGEKTHKDIKFRSKVEKQLSEFIVCAMPDDGSELWILLFVLVVFIILGLAGYYAFKMVQKNKNLDKVQLSGNTAVTSSPNTVGTTSASAKPNLNDSSSSNNK